MVSDGGTVPVSQLPAISSCCSEVSAVISAGMVPRSALKYSNSSLSSVRAPSSFGSVPFSPLMSSLSCVMWPVVVAFARAFVCESAAPATAAAVGFATTASVPDERRVRHRPLIRGERHHEHHEHLVCILRYSGGHTKA